jgi:hypothetical protein
MMIYNLSLLLSILGLVVGIPALRRLMHMLTIRQNSRMVTGSVISTKSAMNSAGWLMGMVSASEMVNHDRPLVTYRFPEGKEMSIEVVPSNFLSSRRYRIGETVEVAYDRSEPWHAYLVREWRATLRELGIGTVTFLVGVILWIIGRIYNLPF